MAHSWRSPALFLTVLLVLGGVPQPAMPAGPPSSGEWVIDDNEVIENQTVSINGKITVNAGASLEILNSTVTFANKYDVYIAAGGALNILNSTVAGPSGLHSQGTIWISGSNLISWSIVVNAPGEFNVTRSTFDNSTIYCEKSDISLIGSTFIRYSPYWGSSILSCSLGNVIVQGCRFADAESRLVDIPDASAPAPFSEAVTIHNNKFERLGGDCISIIESQGSGGPPPTFVTLSSLPPDNMLVSDSSFSGDIDGIHLTYTTSLLISNNRFSSSKLAVGLYNQDDVALVNNSIRNCTFGINVFWVSNASISGTIITNTSRGITTNGNFHLNITGNRITNSAEAIYIGRPAAYPDRSSVVSDNWITGGNMGLSLYMEESEVAGNRITNCTYYAMRIELRSSAPGSGGIHDNTIINCGFGVPANYSAAGIVSSGIGRLNISNNTFLDNPSTGLSVQGQSDITDNNITGSEIGLRLETPPYSMQLMNVRNNSISASRAGILVCETEQMDGSLVISGNEIASGGDGILADGAEVNVSDNDFMQVADYCVHAIGAAASLGANRYPDGCKGIFRQDWYVHITVSEGPFAPSANANVTVRDRNGTIVMTGQTDRNGQIRSPLTQYILDSEGCETQYGPYSLLACKPDIGIANATMQLDGNIICNMTLEGASDIILADLQLPAGRLQPGRLVPVKGNLTFDTTYDILNATLESVKVALYSDGTLLTQTTVYGVTAGSANNYNFLCTLPPGNHTLRVVADPFNDIREVYEDNNELDRNISVNQYPIARLDCDARSILIGDIVNCSAKRSSDDVAVASYLFDFGDGTSTGWTTDNNASHFYIRAGAYNSTLLVMDNEGAISESCDSVIIEVAPDRPLVELGADRTVINRSDRVRFTAVLATQFIDITTIRWDFGDGQNESGKLLSAEHVYSSIGVFSAMVSVFDSDGLLGTSSLLIAVQNRLPQAAFNFSPQECTIDTEVRFTSTTKDPDGHVTSWLWQFGDGTLSTEVEPRHRFTQKGNFTVTLRVQDDSGDWSDQAKAVLRIGNQAPRAWATFTPPTVGPGEPVTFYASCSTDPDDPFSALRFCWSSADGWHAAGLSAQRTFSSPGEHVIRLSVSDPDGATGIVDVVVTVKSEPTTGAAPSGSIAAVSAIALVLVAAGVLYYLKRSGRLRREH